MSRLQVDEIVNADGNGAPFFPFGVTPALFWPSVYVASEAELTAAITTLTGVGGIICAYVSFNVISAITLPSDVMLMGRGFGTSLGLNAPSGSLTLASMAQLRDIRITTDRTSATLVNLSNTFGIVERVSFMVTANTGITCIAASGTSNRILTTRFQTITGSNVAINNTGTDTQTLYNLIG